MSKPTSRQSRLKTLQPRVGTLTARLATAVSHDAHWRAWYGTARWRALRMATLRRDLFTCRACGHIEGDTSMLVCDHVQPHRGDARLFWDADNLQTLCVSCHSGEKQRLEEDARRRGGG